MAPDVRTNAVIGAALTLLTAFVPLSPLLGGGVAGYLHRETREVGARVGALSGVLAAVPLFLVASRLWPITAAGFSAAFVGAFAVGLVALVAAYAVGLGALGGYVGSHVAERRRGVSASERGDPR
ncbi:DUF5518 domain-containing protein [Halomarina halobia]|uniref:DUF5518 domain-containing protein n=1 Tax=Halomarina halobia TaxID=3033386 RepID=A0ABD6A701_9EURY|nr:DUF5518 domain-containing protein [Halomarina sp. PSR21]